MAGLISSYRVAPIAILTLAASVALGPAGYAQEEISREQDIVYGRKFGTALTMDIFRPQKPNGRGLIYVVSGGWFSSHDSINIAFAKPFLDRGYTVFAVVHGSQPRFAIPDILEDMHRATRFIRHNAEKFGIDGEQIGIYGASAGGHLSLMQGAAGKPADPSTKDPVDAESSRVQAVACFFPPTDFLNYGKQGSEAIGNGVLKDFAAPFDFQELKKNGEGSPLIGLKFVEIRDPERRREIGRRISPVNHVTDDDPPMLIIHGDKDELVPIQQAELMVQALEEAGVESELVVRIGEGHGWGKITEDLEILADWFDAHLLSKDVASDEDSNGDKESSSDNTINNN